MNTGDSRMRLDSDDAIPNVKELSRNTRARLPCLHTVLSPRALAAGAYDMGATAVAASAVTLQSNSTSTQPKPPHALTIDEIHELTERYATYALRIAKAGFDGLEVMPAPITSSTRSCPVLEQA